MQVTLNFLCKNSSVSTSEGSGFYLFRVKQTKSKGFVVEILFWQILCRFLSNGLSQGEKERSLFY